MALDIHIYYGGAEAAHWPECQMPDCTLRAGCRITIAREGIVEATNYVCLDHAHHFLGEDT